MRKQTNSYIKFLGGKVLSTLQWC